MLYALPQVPYQKKHIDYFLEICAEKMPDLIFLQFEPMPYLFRQRYMAHKCAMHEVEDYDVTAMEDFQAP